MTTSDYALIISVVSLAIALTALVWNVWQKYIFVKPAIQVTFNVWKVLEPEGADKLVPSKIKLLGLNVTNLGPGPVTLYACIVKTRQKWWSLHKQPAMLNPIHNDPSDPIPTSIGPFSAGLPAKIEAGEMKSFYFPYGKDSFLTENIVKVGVNDTYGRNSWCRSKDVWKVYRQYRKDYDLGTAA